MHKTNNYSYSCFRENSQLYIRSLPKFSRLISKHINHIRIRGRRNRQTSSGGSSSNSSSRVVVVVVVVVVVIAVVATAIKIFVSVAVDCGCFIVQARGTYTHMVIDL